MTSTRFRMASLPKERYRERLAAGVCPQHPTRKLAPGKRRCRECDDYQRRYSRDHSAEKTAAAIAHKKLHGYSPNRPEVNRRAQLKYNYGISIAEYDRMEVEQGGRCAVCRRPPTRGRLHVDHDHVSGAVRRLLCGNCNRALGLLGDNPEVARRAAAYLESFAIQRG